MIQTNNIFPYSGPLRYKDYAIDVFFASVRAHDGTTAVELIYGTKILLTDVYDIGSKSGVNIGKVFQDRFCECGTPINIWSDNAQTYFMGSVHKLLHAYGV